MSEEDKIIERVMMIDQWKVAGDIYTQDELNAIGELLDLYNKEKEKNKLTANDIENFKCQAYMLGRADENEAMKGVIQRHYISKDEIKAKIERIEDLHLAEDFKDYVIRVLQSLLEKE